MSKSITEILRAGAVLGDGGYLIELERRGYVDSGSGREKVGTGRGSGQFTPEVAVEHPEALQELHREFLHAGSHVLQALTFFGTREKLTRAGYGADTERINFAAVKLAKEVAGDREIKRARRRRPGVGRADLDGGGRAETYPRWPHRLRQRVGAVFAATPEVSLRGSRQRV